MRGNLRSDAWSQRPPTAGLRSFLKLLRDWCCSTVQAHWRDLMQDRPTGPGQYHDEARSLPEEGIPSLFQHLICPCYHELTFPPSALEPREARVARVVPDERPLSSVLYSDSASGPGTGEAGASVGPEPGRDGHTVSFRPQSSRQWHGQQVNTMADEDTDWSYSETIPKPQISTLSKTILLLHLAYFVSPMYCSGLIANCFIESF